MAALLERFCRRPWEASALPVCPHSENTNRSIHHLIIGARMRSRCQRPPDGPQDVSGAIRLDDWRRRPAGNILVRLTARAPSPVATAGQRNEKPP